MNLLVKTRRATIALPGQAFWEISGQKEWVVTVKEITKAIQLAFEIYVNRRENFGPSMKKKLGSDFSIGGHGDHIHISVN